MSIRKGSVRDGEMNRHSFIRRLRPWENKNEQDWRGSCLTEGEMRRDLSFDWSLFGADAKNCVLHGFCSLILHHNLRRWMLSFFPFSEWINWGSEKSSHIQGHRSRRESWGSYFHLPFKSLQNCRRESGGEGGSEGRTEGREGRPRGREKSSIQRMSPRTGRKKMFSETVWALGDPA